MVFEEGTMVLLGGCECHGGPYSCWSDNRAKTRTVEKFLAIRGSHFSIANRVCTCEKPQSVAYYLKDIFKGFPSICHSFAVDCEVEKFFFFDLTVVF